MIGHPSGFVKAMHMHSTDYMKFTYPKLFHCTTVQCNNSGVKLQFGTMLGTIGRARKN